MSETLSIFELLETARQKLGVVSACLSDSKKFANAVTDFDVWLKAHSQQFSSESELDQNTREQVTNILRQLARLELQARHNANLVCDMQSYLLEGSLANNYLPNSIAAASQDPEAITRSETAALTPLEDGAPDTLELSESALPETEPSETVVSVPVLRTPAAQIYAKQNQAIHQASQE